MNKMAVARELAAVAKMLSRSGIDEEEAQGLWESTPRPRRITLLMKEMSCSRKEAEGLADSDWDDLEDSVKEVMMG